MVTLGEGSEDGQVNAHGPPRIENVIFSCTWQKVWDNGQKRVRFCSVELTRISCFWLPEQWLSGVRVEFICHEVELEIVAVGGSGRVVG